VHRNDEGRLHPPRKRLVEQFWGHTHPQQIFICSQESVNAGSPKPIHSLTQRDVLGAVLFFLSGREVRLPAFRLCLTCVLPEEARRDLAEKRQHQIC
jgi:hypothetical protein